MRYMAAAVSDAGIIKKVNQDSLTVKIAQTPAGQVCMAVICDGLGGLSLGEVASGNVVRAFDNWFMNEFLESDEEWTQNRIMNRWQEIITSMNQKIMEYGASHGEEMGTTLTVSLFLRDKFYAAHVGDSRLYEISENCRQLTRDQTVVSRELEQGIITEEQALTDNRGNVLLQCIGVTKHLIPDFYCADINNTAAYLLCSDGFRHVVSSEEIYQVCRPLQNLTQEVMEVNLKSLVECNKQRGERDNISAILIQVGNEAC